MSIRVIRYGDTVEVLKCTSILPEGREVELFTAEEVRRMHGKSTWPTSPTPAPTKSFADWIDEAEWDEM